MKTIASVLLGFSLAAIIFACKKSSNKSDKSCFCYDIYDPVCGRDRVTYDNPCRAECAGVKKYKKGECKFFERQ